MSSRFGDNLRTLIIVAAFMAMSVLGFAQAKPKQFVTGEWMIMVSNGTPQATVADIASKVGANVALTFLRVDALGTKDAYLLRSSAVITDSDTIAKNMTLSGDSRVVSAQPHRILQYHKFGQGQGPKYTPNDPRFPEQWDKLQINMPQAWTITKGNINTVVCILDSGVEIDHPEFAGRLLAGYDTTVTPISNDPRPGPGAGHGTHVSGIAMANGDNGVGIAGVAFQNTQLVGIKVGGAVGPTTAAVIAGIDQVLALQKANPSKRFVINCSFGGGVPDGYDFTTDPMGVKILAAAKQDVVFCISAGNSAPPFGTNPEIFPADMAKADPRIICVAASGRRGEHSVYSSFKSYTTITAPGGSDPSFADNSLQILSTLPFADGSYGYEQGTSMAAPQVTGVVSLLLSVPSVSASQIKSIITSTAQTVSGFTIPSPEFGYGIIDAAAALNLVSTSVTITAPSGTGGKVATQPVQPLPVETLRPTIMIHVSNVTPDNLVVIIDNTVINSPSSGKLPAYTITNVTATTVDGSGASVPSTYDVVIARYPLSPGKHTVTVTGSKPVAGGITTTDSDTRVFFIVPHVLPQGRSMVSFPYNDINALGVSSQPQDVLSNGFSLARWNPVTMTYQFYSSNGSRDLGASFTPPVGMAHLDGSNIGLNQVGLGYFIDLDSAKPVLTNGEQVGTTPVVIPLQGSGVTGNFITWNMIGDPFAFDVPLSSCLVDTPAGRLSIQDAVNKGYILSTIFSYDSNNGYTYLSLPDGALKAWSGHWIGVTSTSNIALVVPPNFVTRGVRSSSTGTAIDGWTVRLNASTKGLRDTGTTIGTSSRATQGFNQLSVPKPPMVSSYVSVGVNHNDWANKSGLFAQDIRTPSDKHTWKVVVSTDQSNADVTLGWTTAKLPKATRMTVTDDVTNQVYDMRTKTSMVFNSGNGATSRSFTITSQTGNTQPVRIGNVAVRAPSSRATGIQSILFSLSSDATYEVKIINASGGTINRVATRSVAAGDQQLVWNGKDGNGTNVSSGTYLVHIKAVGQSGDSVTVVYPFSVIR